MIRYFLYAFVSLAALATTATAQSNADKLIPAEVPSEDFEGREYVDSRGCVYVRAGVNGNTTWVPRMTRSREVICDAQPTVAVAQEAEPQQPVVKEVASAVEPKAQPEEPKAVQQAAAVPKPAAKPRVLPRKKPVYVPEAEVYTRAAPRHAPKAPVEGPVKYRQAAQGEVSQRDRIVPRHVYEQNLLTNVPTPYGYREAWDDDRLNPHRAKQTLKGRAQMQLIWTNTVPRKLVDVATGKVMNAEYPKLMYPFTSMAEQEAYQTAKVQAQPKAPKVVKKTPKKVTKKKHASAGNQHYVQIGVFVEADNARYAASHVQRLGYPVAFGNVTVQGRAMNSVLVGPYASQGQMNDALAKLRRLGYGDAYSR